MGIMRKGGIVVDWNDIKAEYIAGGTTYKKLAEKYGVSENTLRRRASKEKWRESRHKADTKATQKIINSASNEKIKRACRVKRSASKTLDNALIRLEKKTEDEDISASDLLQCVRAIKEILVIEGIKPKADRDEQQARIDNLRKQAEKGETDKDVQFVIGDDLEEYAV